MIMKKQYCFNCGEFLGEYKSYYGDIECCGSPECCKEERAVYRQIQEEAEWEAKQDGYSRYGGFGPEY